MKDSEYRCSGCEEIKKISDHKFIEFGPLSDEEIAICKKCNSEMKKLGFVYLIEYLYYSILGRNLELLKQLNKKTKNKKGNK